MRAATLQRATAETQVELSLNLDGRGEADVATGIGFFDHMLILFAMHAAMDLRVRAQGDLHVDGHHTVEDVGLVLGQAVRQALGDKAGIRRYGSVLLPMDESLATVAVDLSGRPFLVWNAVLPAVTLGGFPTDLAEEFWRAVAMQGHFCLHVNVNYGRNPHHLVEAIFKGCGRALRQAVEPDPRELGIPSTKGTL